MQVNIWKSSSKTDIGTVRKVNEDSFLDAPNVQLWCVADGMGGHAKGDLASQMIVKSLDNLAKTKRYPLTVQQVNHCLQEVNSTLVEMADAQQSVIGSTVVVLLLDEHQAHFIWAGDSRIYRLRNGSLKRVTRDHSQVEDMVQAGLLAPEQAENHPNANVITRAVGASDLLEIEVKSEPVLTGDQFFLCSDGLNKVMEDREIERAMINMPLDTITQSLIATSLERGASDNVTVLAVRNIATVDTARFKPKPSITQDQLDDTLPLKS